MSKKLKNEELKNVSGGCGGGGKSSTTQEETYVCSSPTCGHTFKYTDSVRKDGNIYCPKCNTFIAKDDGADYSD